MRSWVVILLVAIASIGFILTTSQAEAQAFDLLQSKPGQPLPSMPGYGRLNPKAKADDIQKYEREQAARPEPSRQPAKDVPFVGVQMYDANSVASYNVPSLTQGPWIIAVDPNGPAAGADLRRGDIILSVNGEKTVSPAEVSRIVSSQQIGTELKFGIQRDMKEIEISLKVGRRPSAPELDQETQSKVDELCKFNVFTDSSDSDKVALQRAHDVCSRSVVQAKEKTNQPLFDKLKDQFAACGSESILSDRGRNRVYETVKAIDLTDDDFATIFRVAAFCKLKGLGDLPMSFAMWQTANSVVTTFGADRRKATIGFIEARLMVANSRAIAAREEKRRASLASAGYKSVSIQDLKIDARELHGQKVAVSGLLVLIDNNHAALMQNKNDTNPVGVLLEDASRETRAETVGHCTGRRACQIEIKGMVIGDRDSVLIRAD